MIPAANPNPSHRTATFATSPPVSNELSEAVAVLHRSLQATLAPPQIIVEFATARNACAFGRETLKSLGYARSLSLFKRHFKVDEYTYLAVSATFIRAHSEDEVGRFIRVDPDSGWEELMDNVARLRIS